jgi:integrase
MSSKQSQPKHRQKSVSFRVGRVSAYLRGKVWYLRYHEAGQRRQPRVGPDRVEAKKLAAEINAQLEVGAPSALGFEPIPIPEVRERWLEHHEHIRRSSVNTVRRYSAATAHLINFVDEVRPVRRVSDFRPRHAEEFVCYLRTLITAPNGHKNAAKRRLRDSGVKFILETCSTLFSYAQRQRHLPPYAENPFQQIEIGRIPVEDAKPIVVFDEELEYRFLAACDDWQFPVYLTLLMTGLRPGELVHLLLPEDLDLKNGWLYIRNKPKLGWQVKTRNERDIPIVPALAKVLIHLVDKRQSGPVFQQRRCHDGHKPLLCGLSQPVLEQKLVQRIAKQEAQADQVLTRKEQQAIASSIWRDLGTLRTDWIRNEFMRVSASIGSPEITAPKTLRHTFATILQDANVDPLIRNELMGHAPASAGYLSTSGNGSSSGLGMTAIYTHSRPETKRHQLGVALADRLSEKLVAGWIDRN